LTGSTGNSNANRGFHEALHYLITVCALTHRLISTISKTKIKAAHRNPPP